MPMRFVAITLGTISMVLGVSAVTLVMAQNAGVPAVNSIHIAAGEMLEIGMEATSPKSDFSWILTKDRKFQNAQRTRFFGLRPAQTGVYVLDVSVQDPLLSQNDYRAFNIVVSEPNPLPPPRIAQDGPVKAVLTTVPATIDGTVYLQPDEGAMLSLDGAASTGKITSYFFDLDNTLDGNNDGDTENDRDNQDTFSEKSGSPLTYFMTKKAEPRILSMTVTDAVTGQTDRTSVTVVFGPAPAAPINPPSADPNSAIIIAGSGMTARFEARLPTEIGAGKELLQEWDFGDRSRSLLTNPVHTYTMAGTFTVSLTVRDITNGQVVYTGTNAVTVQQPIGAVASSASSQASNVSSSVSSTGGTETSGSFGSIVKVLMIILMILGVAIGLYALFTWIKRKTGGHLEKAIESMEKNIVKNEKKEEAKIEPLKIKKDAPVPASVQKTPDVIIETEKSKTEFAAPNRAAPAPSTTSAPVPSWLSKASTTAAPAAITPKAATPVEQTAAPVATPTPASAPVAAPVTSVTPAPKPATAANTAPVPDWLKQAPKTAEAVPSAQMTPSISATVTAPIQTPTPKPPAAPVTTPVAPLSARTPAPVKPATVVQAPVVQPTVVAPAIPPATPKPITPTPAPNPTPAPKIAAPIVVPQTTKTPEKPTPAAAKPSAPITPPAPKTAALETKTAPQTVAATKPAVTETKQVPKPATVPEKKPAPMQDIPKATPKQDIKKESPKKDDDQPIAFIQADSLTNPSTREDSSK